MSPGDTVRARQGSAWGTDDEVCMFYLPGPAGENSCGGSGDCNEESGHMEVGSLGLVIAVVDGECLVLWLDEGVANYGWQGSEYFEVVR